MGDVHWALQEQRAKSWRRTAAFMHETGPCWHPTRSLSLILAARPLPILVQESAAVATPYYPYYEDITGHGTNVTHSPGLNATIDVYREIVKLA